MKTKLEQCLRLIYAMDEDGRVELRFVKSLEKEDSGELCGFGAQAFDSHDGMIETGAGDTPEEAIDDLHTSLHPFAERMLNATEYYEAPPPKNDE